MILVRMNQLIWPTADEKSGTIELLAEVFGEVVFTGIIVFIIYRLIDFIPTYSGIPLKSINILSIITVFILTLPWYDNTSNLGTKIAILHKRIDARLPAFFGIQQDKTKVINNNNNNNNELQVAQPTHKPSRADYLGAQNRLSIGNPPQSNQPNFDNMYGLSSEDLQKRGLRILPQSLPEAIEELERDDVIMESLGVIAKEFVNLKKAEWQEYHAQIGQWEIDRYLTML